MTLIISKTIIKLYAITKIFKNAQLIYYHHRDIIYMQSCSALKFDHKWKLLLIAYYIKLYLINNTFLGKSAIWSS